MTTVGLVVNPVAGLGGRVGLKGSDGVSAQHRARALGAEPRAGERARIALVELVSRLDGEPPTVATAAGPMGADIVRAAGLDPVVVHEPGDPTSAADTMATVRALRDVDLLLFAGGDGTARDVLDGLPGASDGPRTSAPIVTLGIPTGVKMHSAVFAVNPRAAGESAAALLAGAGRVRLRDAEVMDLDEEAVRDGRVSARLYGHLPVPDLAVRIQQRKVGSVVPVESIGGIAREVADRLAPGDLLVLGPGTTIRSVAAALGVDVPVMAVNALRCAESPHPTASRSAAPAPGGFRLVEGDVAADRLLALVDETERAWVAVSPIGGQGFVFGRGNQQISPEVLRAVGRDRLLVVATEAKLAALGGRPLLVDTGDERLDDELAGHLPILTAHRTSTMYRLR